METLQRIAPPEPQPSRKYWLKIYLKDPFSIQFLGPFSSPDEANNTPVNIKTQGQTVVSRFPIAHPNPPSPPNSPMSHTQWLQGLTEDYLQLKVASAPRPDRLGLLE